jgi:hypothetical protein
VRGKGEGKEMKGSKEEREEGRGKEEKRLWVLCKTRELLPITFRVLDDMKVRERKERKGEEGRGKGERDRRGREVKRWGKGEEGWWERGEALCKTPELLPIAFRVLDDMKVRDRKEERSVRERERREGKVRERRGRGVRGRGRKVKMRGKRGKEERLWALRKTPELLPIAFRVLDDMKVRAKGEEGRGKGERERRGREVKMRGRGQRRGREERERGEVMSPVQNAGTTPHSF